MSPRPARWALLLVALTACASARSGRPTRVDREERVVADTPERTRWFATLHSLQRQLATADARRIDVLGPLQAMLCLAGDASLSRLGAVAQARMAQSGTTLARTRLRRTADAEQALARWIDAAVTSTGDLAEREALTAVEETLVIERVGPSGFQRVALPTAAERVPEPRCEPGAAEGAQGVDGPTVLRQLGTVLRRSAAQGLMFQLTVTKSRELGTQLRSLSEGAPGALAAEFAAAGRALTGVTARATMHLHESARTEQWALALHSPEGEAPIEEQPEVPPPDAPPEGVAPETITVVPAAGARPDAGP